MFENLAELGKVDLELSQLRYRLLSSPEVVRSNNLKSQISGLLNKMTSVNSALAEVENSESGLEKRQEKIRLRAHSLENETKTNSSLSYRDQEAVATELSSLLHQLENLEDEELHLLEEEELLSEKQSELKEEMTALRDEEKSLQGVIDVMQTDIKGRIGELDEQRSNIIKHLNPEVAAIYKSLYPRYQDSCVATIEAGKCSGCHLQLSASEVEICKRNSGEINYCEQCGRILLSV